MQSIQACVVLLHAIELYNYDNTISIQHTHEATNRRRVLEMHKIPSNAAGGLLAVITA